MEKKELKTKVFEAIGEASMCWSSEPLGIFDSNDAKRIGDDLLNYVQKYSDQQNQELLIKVEGMNNLMNYARELSEQITILQSDKRELIESFEKAKLYIPVNIGVDIKHLLTKHK